MRRSPGREDLPAWSSGLWSVPYLRLRSSTTPMAADVRRSRILFMALDPSEPATAVDGCAS